MDRMRYSRAPVQASHSVERYFLAPLGGHGFFAPPPASRRVRYFRFGDQLERNRNATPENSDMLLAEYLPAPLNPFPSAYRGAADCRLLRSDLAEPLRCLAMFALSRNVVSDGDSILFVDAGAVVGERTLLAGLRGWGGRSIVVSVAHLQKDLSYFRVVEDFRFKQLMEFLKDTVSEMGVALSHLDQGRTHPP